MKFLNPRWCKVIHDLAANKLQTALVVLQGMCKVG